MVVRWLCWHITIWIRNITQKHYSQFPPVHDFRKPWWGVAYVPCMTNLRAIFAWVIQWHVTCMLSLAGHWQGRRALSNHVSAHSVISMWHVVCLQHLARVSNEQSRSTTVLPINHVIHMPQCLSGFVNHDYWKAWIVLGNEHEIHLPRKDAERVLPQPDTPCDHGSAPMHYHSAMCLGSSWTSVSCFLHC